MLWARRSLPASANYDLLLGCRKEGNRIVINADVGVELLGSLEWTVTKVTVASPPRVDSRLCALPVV
jgi:hypothetical protein